jgi:hypothetical protein
LCNEEHLNYFKFIGRIAGMAVYHGKLLDGKQCSSLISNPLLLCYTNLWHYNISYSCRGWMKNVMSDFVTHWNNGRVLSIWTCVQNGHVSYTVTCLPYLLHFSDCLQMYCLVPGKSSHELVCFLARK